MSKAICHLTNKEIVSIASAAGATEPHEDVSSRYSFVPTIQAVDLLRSVGWLPIEAKQSGVRKAGREGFQRHMIRFMKEGLAFNGERVDLLLINSHDRGCAFKLMAGVWRSVCSNGLVVGDEVVNFTHKHMRFDGNAFVESALSIGDAAGQIANHVEDIKAIELTGAEKGVFAMAAHKLVYDEPDKAPIRPLQLLEERRKDDKGCDLWTTFNVIQENMIKGGVPGRTIGDFGKIRRTTTRKVNSIERDIKLNKALWMLTEKMKELITG